MKAFVFTTLMTSPLLANAHITDAFHEHGEITAVALAVGLGIAAHLILSRRGDK